jgi:N-acetylmuramoyl-L-alanine amidase
MASVILDAGHGGYDNGASYQGRKEKEDNLNLALAVGNILQNNGVDVKYTRTEDVYQSPKEKAALANEKGGDLFVSIHRNSSTSPNQYSGVQTLVYEDDATAGQLAKNLDNALSKAGFTNLGTWERKDLPVLRETSMPAALVEVGFLNTDRDNLLLDTKFPEVAQAIANGILQTLEAPLDTLEATQEKGENTSHYSVEVGAFSHFNNAKGLAYNLQEDGFDCYISERQNYYLVCQGDYSSLPEAQKGEKELYESGYETKIIPFLSGKSCKKEEKEGIKIEN